VLYIIGASYTIASHATLLFNLSGICIIVYRYFKNEPIDRLEYIGTVITIGGVFMMACDTSASKTDSAATNIILGDFLSFLGSIALVVVLFQAAALGKVMPT
jgi:drug/metabolite transporter (DMT)-like permease